MGLYETVVCPECGMEFDVEISGRYSDAQPFLEARAWCPGCETLLKVEKERHARGVRVFVFAVEQDD